MKKILISMMLIAGITTAFAADVTTRAKITLGSSSITVRESADLSDAEESGYDAPLFGTSAITVSASGKDWVEWGTNNLEGVKIAFTPAAENVSFAFSNVKGDLYLVDKTANKRHKIVAGEPYAFTVAASEVGTANANRFYISKIAGKDICYKYEALEISDYNGWNLTVTEKGQASPTINVPIESDYFKQSLADKNAGYYVVKLSKSGEDDIEYIISVKPTVFPAN